MLSRERDVISLLGLSLNYDMQPVDLFGAQSDLYKVTTNEAKKRLLQEMRLTKTV